MDYSLDKAIEILRQTPKTLHTYLSNLSNEWTLCNEGEDTWCAYDIVGHLIHGEKTDWMQRIKIVLNQIGDKTFEPFDRFAQFETSKGKNLEELLKEFSHLREKNLNKLNGISIKETQLNLKANHPELGEVTLRQLLSTWVVHDLGHIAQIARVMAKQYKHEVGPWKEYLPILNK